MLVQSNLTSPENHVPTVVLSAEERQPTPSNAFGGILGINNTDTSEQSA